MNTLFTFIPALPDGACCEDREYPDGIFKTPELHSPKVRRHSSVEYHRPSGRHVGENLIPACA